MKKKLIIIITIFIIMVSIVGIYLIVNIKDELPKPELSSGQRGTLGIDKNINEKTIDKYLDRKDSVYYDVRMLKDEANWEKIGGDSYLSGFVKGFEVLPYPYLVDDSINKDLEKIVGEGYIWKSLFTNNNGNYKSNYKESLEILEYFFSKNKNIFLMCGGGGYAGQTKKLLVSLGWDENKIYDVGGYWYYSGKNNIKVKVKRNKKDTYDFWKVTYHNIDFTTLTGE